MPKLVDPVIADPDDIEAQDRMLQCPRLCHPS